MLLLADVTRRQSIRFPSYADDTQLYIAVSPEDLQPVDTLFNCILDLKLWMEEHFLQLNQDKTEVLVPGSDGEKEKPLPKLQIFKPSDSRKNLGVIFDPELHFLPHVRNTTKTAFFHLKNTARVCLVFSQAITEILMHAFICSRLDYCNALLPKKIISSL